MFEELETIVLTHDIKAHGLRRGDVGAIVHAHEEGKAYEVEFIDSTSGRTIALLTLSPTDILPINANVLTPLRGIYDNLEHSALGGLSWTIEPIKPYMVGTATVIINTKSNKNESRAEMFNYQTI